VEVLLNIKASKFKATIMQMSQPHKDRLRLFRVSSLRNLRITGKQLIQKPRNAYFGSFDPFTKGHLSVYRRATETLGDVSLVIVKNPLKLAPVFSLKERERIIRSYLPQVEVFYARDYQEAKDLQQRLVKVIIGKRNQSEKQYVDFLIKFYDITRDKIHLVVDDEAWPEISSSKLKQLVLSGELEAARALANDFTINWLEKKTKHRPVEIKNLPDNLEGTVKAQHK
jgi:cytidyltransferase-like protein